MKKHSILILLLLVPAHLAAADKNSGAVCFESYLAKLTPDELDRQAKVIIDGVERGPMLGETPRVVAAQLDLGKRHLLQVKSGDTVGFSQDFQFNNKAAMMNLRRSPGYWHLEPSKTGRCGEEPAITSVFTGLDPGSCVKDIDKSDPNETPYYLCQGPANYKLIVRSVDSGKESIDVVDPSGRASPLFLAKYVAPHMFNLTGKAEWRVAAKAGKSVPLALIVRVQSRQDKEDPAKVTHTYDLVAKITPQETCVTDRILVGTPNEAEMRRLAEKTPDRICQKGY